jgi:hypothetical protein
MKIGDYVLVTTEYRGVFAGELVARDDAKRTMSLDGARCAIYWSADVGGVLGLAESGPSSSCRIGATADVDLFGVTSVSPVTRGAERLWRAASVVGR